MESILDEARTWFLDRVVYEDRQLVIRVVEGLRSDQAEDLRVGEVVLHGTFRVEPGPESWAAIVRFMAPIAWEVVDESFTGADQYEEHEGKGSLQVLTRSRYLDHVQTHHGWFEQMRGPAKHYRVWTENEVIEVVACEPPQVEPADDPWREEAPKPDEAQSLDFGAAKVAVATTRTPDGRPVTRISISGSFDGFEKGKSGDLLGYLVNDLPKSAERVLLVLSHATYYSDLAPGLVESLRRSLRARGGDVVLVAPTPGVAEVLRLLNEPFSTTEKEALMELDRGWFR